MNPSDLDGPADEVAKRLLGATLWTEINGRTAVLITEVEAYGGADDAASHAFRGPTRGNAAMFGRAGTLYVYRSYGIHWCANVAAGREGEGGAVLLRGGRITDGRGIIEYRRGRHDRLTDGPGKLAQALAITGEHDGTRITNGPVRIELTNPLDTRTITATPRIGITRETSRLWRFTVRST